MWAQVEQGPGILGNAQNFWAGAEHSDGFYNVIIIALCLCPWNLPQPGQSSLSKDNREGLQVLTAGPKV